MVLSLAFAASFETSAERSFVTKDDVVPLDFPVFYLGGKVALQKGATPLYYPPADPKQGYTLLYKYSDNATPWANLARENGFPKALQYTNPPLSALLMVPFAMLPWRWGYFLWQVFTVILAGASILLVLGLLPSGHILETFAVMLAGVCFFFPFRTNLTFGQANVTILFIWTLGVYLLHRHQPVASALCFALGTALKISPVVAVPLLVLRRQWRWLATYVAGLTAFTAVSVWDLGWRSHVIWFRAIYPCISSGLGNDSNRSLAGLLDALVGPRYFVTLAASEEWPIPHGLVLFEKACGAAILLGFFFWCWRKRQDDRSLIDELILLPLVYLLAAPFSWPQHFVLALLPLTYFWAKAREATRAERVALYLGTLVLGTELPMYIAAYSPLNGPHLIVLAIALWPAATCTLIWVGMRMHDRPQIVKATLAAPA